jgi:adenylate cyclase
VLQRCVPKLPRGVLSDLGPWLLEFRHPGEGGLSGRRLWRVGQLVLTSVIVTTNLIGAATVVTLSLFVVPLPVVPHIDQVRLANTVAAALYVVVAVPIGVVIGTRGQWLLRDWLIDEGPATEDVRRVVLRAPLRLFVVQTVLWFGAAALFGTLNSIHSPLAGLMVALVVALTGVVTAACAYLLAERIMRIAAARALADAIPERLAVPGVATRAVLAWALGTGVPTAGLVAIGIAELTGQLHTSPSDLAVAVVALGGIGLGIGLLAVTLAARATADPVDSVRRALSGVEHGAFDVHVPVYDGTQIGQLQMGFNQMVAGLAERERIRNAFGTYVDPDVVAHILSEGTNLEGEEVEVTILFIDVRDFTGFAERTAAHEVVTGINRLFEVVVPIIRAHGGHVDKFIGDGLMAVFGAPRRQPDHADRALATALEVARAIGAGAAGPLRVGIGLNSGAVVAGNVGGAGRFEFSVIGDAVNVAARVESATRETGDSILLTEHTKDLLRADHGVLQQRTGLTLKGKSNPVMVYAPFVE